MKRFAALVAELDRTTSILDKVSAMRAYFEVAPPPDAAWALYLLTGRRLKRLIGRHVLWEAIQRASGLPGWLLGECYDAVGDSAETAALLLDGRGKASAPDRPLHEWIESMLIPSQLLTDAEKVVRILQWWDEVGEDQLFVFNKVMTGGFRIGVSQTLVERAIAESANLEPTTIAHRLMGTWSPTAEWYARLLSRDTTKDDLSRPFPFFLATALDDDPSQALGAVDVWQVEWKWDGIRAQLVRRGSAVHLWSRGEELISERFPEIVEAAARLPSGTVLDGEVLAFEGERPLPFAALQRRIGRKALTARILERSPVIFMAYDVLEWGGEDWRERPLDQRRDRLEKIASALPSQIVPIVSAGETGSLFAAAESERQVISGARIRVSEVLPAESWDDVFHLRQSARERGVEGVMLKRLDSAYGVGRRKGDWWKWKVDPYTVDAVLVYAQPGSGRRASLHTDYTFGVWDDGRLVPFAKAYSGLTNEEIITLDAWVRSHTVDKFGPVRAVEPVHVFELAFEAIALSPRHKSGIAVRFPRILRWRTDKPASEADTLGNLKELIRAKDGPPGRGRRAKGR